MPPELTVAQALEQIASALCERYSDGVPVAELRRETARLGGFQEHSVIPSDFCYNRTNVGIPLLNNPMFIQQERGLYRYVGRGYLYTGPMLHKPRGGAERQVGQWLDGQFTPNTSQHVP